MRIFLKIFFLPSLLEYNCFIMVGYFLLYNKVNQLYIYIYPYISSLLRLPPTLPIPPLKIFFFWCGPFLKSLLNLLQYCFCFTFWFFGCEACGILVHQPGIEPSPSALEDKVLTTGLPGNSLKSIFSISFENTKQPIFMTVFKVLWNFCSVILNSTFVPVVEYLTSLGKFYFSYEAI